MFVTVFLLVAIAQIARSEEYTSKYNSEVDAALKSDRLLKNYLDCVLEIGPCSPAGEELKKDIPDALKTDCTKCTDEHKENVKKVVSHLIKNKPDWWRLLTKKFDPEGVYEQKYRNILEKEGLVK